MATVLEPRTTFPDSFITSSELRRRLGVSDSTLRLWRRKGLPHVGGETTRPRYDLGRVLDWLGEHGRARSSS
ncbi:MAG: hypothetical protein HYY76_14700 [Acidobacteria bacterium]|nr:hypothetical protein [Acidobacteriota bacterium]